MGDKTTIEWTDATWNPIRGCTAVSEGCRNCYAMRLAARFSGPGEAYEGLAKMTPEGGRWTGELRMIPKTLEAPLRWKRPRKIFVNSMSDLFHDKVTDDVLGAVFSVMNRCPQHTFQILTKRPKRMVQHSLATEWPSNVWAGTSVEDQEVAHRIDELRKVRAAVRFLSIEPMIGPLPSLLLDGIHWVIVGGESGNGARLMREEWALEVAEQCHDQGVAFFFKQTGSVFARSVGVESGKGGDLDRVPVHPRLRVRQFPNVLRAAEKGAIAC